MGQSLCVGQLGVVGETRDRNRWRRQQTPGSIVGGDTGHERECVGVGDGLVRHRILWDVGQRSSQPDRPYVGRGTRFAGRRVGQLRFR